MMKFIRNLLHRDMAPIVVRIEQPPAPVLQQEKIVEPSLAVIRALAGSISVIDVDFVNETSEERRDNLLKAHTIIKDGILSLVIQDLINDQLNFTTKESQSWEQVIFARGTLNGILLVRDAIETLSLKYQEIVEKEKTSKDFDPHETI